MKSIILILSVFLVGSFAEDKYTIKYDNIDIDEILKSDRLFDAYISCLLENGHCTRDGSELKRILPDALEHECSKCSEKQKAGSTKIIHFLIDNKPDIWKQLEAKYDKEGVYKRKYEEVARKEGIYL